MADQVNGREHGFKKVRMSVEDSPNGTRSMPVASVLRLLKGSLSKAEIRVAEALMANYPVSGITTASALAAQAGVSDPTVTRLVAKLGYGSFAEMRDTLIKELEVRLSPPTHIEGKNSSATNKDLALQSADNLRSQLTRTVELISSVDLDTCVSQLADLERGIYITGGRVTKALAMHASWTLQVIRPKVSYIGDNEGARINALLDIGKSSVVVLFDFRRYQKSAVDFAESCAKAGAFMIVVTDPYLSPASAYANLVLTSEIEGLAPFNTMVPTLALLELLSSLVAQKILDTDKSRLDRYVGLSNESAPFDSFHTEFKKDV